MWVRENFTQKSVEEIEARLEDLRVRGPYREFAALVFPLGSEKQADACDGLIEEPAVHERGVTASRLGPIAYAAGWRLSWRRPDPESGKDYVFARLVACFTPVYEEGEAAWREWEASRRSRR